MHFIFLKPFGTIILRYTAIWDTHTMELEHGARALPGVTLSFVLCVFDPCYLLPGRLSVRSSCYLLLSVLICLKTQGIGSINIFVMKESGVRDIHL